MTQSLKQSSADKAYIVGVLLGDGSLVTNNRDEKVIALQAADKDFVVEFGKALCRLADLNWSGYGHEDTEVVTSTHQYNEDNWSDVHSVQKGAASIHYELRKCMNLSARKLREEFDGNAVPLLRGLWDSEGSIESKTSRVIFTNEDKKVLKLYVELLNTVFDADSVASDTYIKEDSTTDCSHVVLPNSYTHEFLEKVNPTIQRKVDSFTNNSSQTTER
jgi:hypothetical protein